MLHHLRTTFLWKIIDVYIDLWTASFFRPDLSDRVHLLSLQLPYLPQRSGAHPGKVSPPRGLSKVRTPVLSPLVLWFPPARCIVWKDAVTATTGRIRTDIATRRQRGEAESKKSVIERMLGFHGIWSKKKWRWQLSGTTPMWRWVDRWHVEVKKGRGWCSYLSLRRELQVS